MKKEEKFNSSSLKDESAKYKNALISNQTLRSLLNFLLPLYVLRLAFIDTTFYSIIILQILCLIGLALNFLPSLKGQSSRIFSSLAILVLHVEIFEVLRDPSLFYYFWCLAPSFIVFVCIGSGVLIGTIVSSIMALFIYLLIYQQKLWAPILAPGNSGDFLSTPPDSETLLLFMLGVQVLILLVIAIFRAPFSSNEVDVQKRRISRLKSGHRLVLSHTLGRLAHELNNPLAVLDASLCAFEKMTKPEAERMSVLSHARSSAERLQKVLDNLNAFLNGDTTEATQTVAVNELVREIESRSSELLASYGVPLKVENRGQGKAVLCRPQQVLFVGLVIMENAAESMKGEANPVIRLKICLKNKRVRFEFEDQGIGIPKDLRDQIFLPFFSSKAPGTLGLSLSTSKVLIEEQKGRIGYEAMDHGSRFYFELPEAPASHQRKGAEYVLSHP